MGSFSMVIPVLSPSTYMTISLKNKKITPRIDSFSIEQAVYFEPFQEGDIKMELLQALRSSNLSQLRAYLQCDSGNKNNNNKNNHNQKKEEVLHRVCYGGSCNETIMKQHHQKQQQQQQQQQLDHFLLQSQLLQQQKQQSDNKNEGTTMTTERDDITSTTPPIIVTNDNNNDDDDDETEKKKKNQKLQELRACNRMGENLLHLACRMGISRDIIEFLVEGDGDEANDGDGVGGDEDSEAGTTSRWVPLNVRDKFGRTPLHNACMSAIPQFDNVDFVIKHAPKLLVMEDDNGKIPFDLIPSRCFERWTRFLSEQNILPRVVSQLS